MGWGSPNLPKHSIHLGSLARGGGRGRVGITGFQPNIYCLLDQHCIEGHNKIYLKNINGRFRHNLDPLIGV